MDYCYWLLVTFTLCFALPAKGHEACYEDSWAYHDFTYTCFKIFQIALTWPEARDNCSQVQVGSRYGVTTRLAKIDDRHTNSFVRALLPDESWQCWIGLYYNTDKHAFRWDGYPDETLIFNPVIWDDQYKPYVSIRRNGWKGMYPESTQYFLCQHSAKKIPPIVCEHEVRSFSLNITCISRDNPIQAKCQWTHKYDTESTFPEWQAIDNRYYEPRIQNIGDNPYITSCWTTLFNLNPGNLTVKMQMYPNISGMDLSSTPEAVTEGSLTIKIEKPQNAIFSLSPNEPITGPDVILVQETDVALFCSAYTGSPAVYSTWVWCDPQVIVGPRYVTRISQENHFRIESVSRDMDGKECMCFANHVTGNTVTTDLTFTIVTKPTSVVCNRNLSPTSLQVSCQTDKIYPQALCEWSYRQENEEAFNPVSATNETHESYTDINGTLYFKSNCSMTLTPSSMTFTAGDNTVQVTINPDQPGIAQNTTPEAFITIQEIFNIEVPNKPQFKMNNKIVQTSSPMHFNENDTIHLLCEIQSGKPTVHSVTMSCEFPFTDADEDNRHTVPGTTYIMDEKASFDMHGKHCTCIGHHLTGRIDSSPLTFYVGCAQVKDQVCSSNLGTGTIVGLIFATNVVVVILTILSMIAFRKLRKRNKHKANTARGDGHINTVFHTSEEKAPDSGYVDVSEHPMSPGKKLPSSLNAESDTGIYEGEEMQDIDTIKYENADEVDERGKKGLYDTIHADDPTYVNLNRDPLRKYITISPGDTGTSGVYHDPI